MGLALKGAWSFRGYWNFQEIAHEILTFSTKISKDIKVTNHWKLKTLFCGNDEFDYNNPTAESLFRIIMCELHQFERAVPLKNQRENSMNTIKNAKIEDITCDGNGACLKTRTKKRYYCLLVKDGPVINKNCSQFRQWKFYLNQRNGRDYEAMLVDINDVYLTELYYGLNKSIPLLRQMIVRIKAVKTGLSENYCCVVYTKSEDKESAKIQSLLPHKNAKSFTRPYIMTSLMY